jgi:AraC-like DNA-binding protein
MFGSDSSFTTSADSRVLVNIARTPNEFAVVCAMSDRRYGSRVYAPMSLRISESRQEICSSRQIVDCRDQGDDVEIIRQTLTSILVKALTHGCTDQDLFVRHMTIALCAIIECKKKEETGPFEETVPGGLKPWQKRVAEHMLGSDEQPGKPLPDVARACGLSTPHFGRAFTKSFSVPPHRWLLIRRLEKAKALLMEPEQTLANIANECGFFDQSHLSHAFSRYFGQSPGAWRISYRSSCEAAL